MKSIKMKLLAFLSVLTNLKEFSNKMVLFCAKRVQDVILNQLLTLIFIIY